MERNENQRICLTGRILILVGAIFTAFLPFIGIFPFAGSIYLTKKQATVDMKHIFILSIIGLACSLFFFIYTMSVSFTMN